jgi:methionyl-tRNA formyltransferase
VRVVLIASAPPPAVGFSQLLGQLGHDVVALIAYRAPAGRWGPAYPLALHEAAPDGDLAFVRSGRGVGPLLRAYAPDLALCATFPARIPDEALDVPRHGIVNMHPSLLPRYRGPNPVGWALRNGDDEIGMTLHRMTSGYDEGPILAQARFAVDVHDDPHADGFAKFAAAAQQVLAEALERVEAGERGDPQDDAQASYAGVFEPEYLEVDVGRTAREVHHQVRAWKIAPPVNGLRGPFLELEGQRVRLLRTRLDDTQGGTPLPCADGPLWILESEPAEG